MLGKLINYEFKHTARTMLITYAALAVATLMGSIALFQIARGNAANETFSSITYIVLLVVYGIVIVGIYCVDFIYLSYQYYKTMYSSQGYLTHTLPVSPAAVLGSKILVFFVWMLFTTMITVLSLLVLLQIGSGGEFFDSFNDVSWSDFSESTYHLFGMSPGLLLFLFSVISLLGILLYILWITASMAIGQLSQKNRTICSILAAFGFYIADQILSTAVLVSCGYTNGAFLNGGLTSFMHIIIGSSIGMTTLFIVVLYGICLYINSRKLNLE